MFKKIANYQFEEYDKKILEYLMPYFYKILPLGSIISLLTISIYFVEGDTNSPSLFLSALFLIALLASYLVRNTLPPTIILNVMLFLLYIQGLYSYFQFGFLSSGFIIVITCTILSMIFLHPVVTWLYITTTFLATSKIVLNVNSGTLTVPGTLDDYIYNMNQWTLIIAGLIAIIAATYIAIIALKTYLLKAINLLEEKINELSDKNDAIEFLAYNNTLTNLPNRIHLERLVDRRLKNITTGSFILLDIKDFHKVNAFYGMKDGDQIIKEIAKYTKKLSKNSNGICGHLSGNTFAIWIDYVISESDMIETLDKYESAFNQAIDLITPLSTYCITIPYRNEDFNFNTIYNLADRFLRKLKQDDSVSHIYFTSKAYASIASYNKLTMAIEDAVMTKEFEIFYQEKHNTKSNTVVGLEALTRLNVNGRLISPSQFIPMIDEQNLSMEFGWIVIEKVFQELPQVIKKYGDKIIVSINISPHQLRSNEFYTKLNQYIEKYNIQKNVIEFEITENVVIGNLEGAIEILNKIREMGIRISIDDFGTGYSSLQYICDLPIDVLKIDKSFIDNIDIQDKARAIVSAIVQLAKTVDIDVVAEGVENKYQLRVLEEIGCSVIQGYYFSKPKPLDVIREFDPMLT